MSTVSSTKKKPAKKSHRKANFPPKVPTDSHPDADPSNPVGATDGSEEKLQGQLNLTQVNIANDEKDISSPQISSTHKQICEEHGDNKHPLKVFEKTHSEQVRDVPTYPTIGNLIRSPSSCNQRVEPESDLSPTEVTNLHDKKMRKRVSNNDFDDHTSKTLREANAPIYESSLGQPINRRRENKLADDADHDRLRPSGNCGCCTIL